MRSNVILTSVAIFVVMQSVILSVVMLSVIYAECRFAKCHYAEWRYAKCHYAEWRYAKCQRTLKGGGGIKKNSFLPPVFSQTCENDSLAGFDFDSVPTYVFVSL